MKILLTGGSGYLGSILSRKLLENGHSVRILDNFLFGTKSIKEIENNKNLEIVKGDIRDLSIVSKSLKNIESVIHLASIVGAQSSELDPKTSIEINLMATRNIAELCKMYKIKQLVFASTCSVYGAQPNQFISENSEVNPLDSYGQSKFQSERAPSTRAARRWVGAASTPAAGAGAAPGSSRRTPGARSPRDHRR